jgi:tetratricopeptide (TPR) repeat protein
VRYLLEGSVQRSGNRLRVNVQLIDAETRAHLWAERFDKPVADLFDMQDEIVARLAGQLGAQLIAAEARRAEKAPHPDSMDLYFQGRACLNKGLATEYLTQASGFFERALARDAGSTEALVAAGWIDFYRATLFVDNRAALLAAAEASMAKALSLAPDHAFAHACLGNVLMNTNRATEGIAECERALVLDRNLTGAHAAIRQRQVFYWSRRGNRGSHRRGSPTQSSRYGRARMDGGGGHRQTCSLPRRRGDRVATPRDRSQPKLPDGALVARCGPSPFGPID